MYPIAKVSDQTLWFVLSYPKIGGVERRMLNLATQATEKYPELAIKLLITPDLYKQYHKDTQLGPLLSGSKVQIELVETARKPKLQQPPASNSLLHKFWRKLRQKLTGLVGKIIPGPKEKSLARRGTPLPIQEPQNFEQLTKNSWLEKFLKFTAPGDDVHCFGGRIERNGGILLSQQKRKVVLEIINNRNISNVVSDLKCILSNIGACPNLKINCLSKTVYQNFISEIGIAFLQEYQITCTYYKTPCLPSIKTSSPQSVELPRENVIVFGHRFIAPKNGLLLAKVVTDMYQQGELKGWKVHFRGRGEQTGAIKQALMALQEAGIADVRWSNDIEGELRQAKIFISIIETGSYPSQSVFQAMRNGNLLVLGDAGETAERFAHKDVYFTKINESAIRQILINAMSDAAHSDIFEAKSKAMKQFFQSFYEQSNQATELISLHYDLETV